MSYLTLSSQEKHLFLLCSYFHAHPTTLLLQILGGPMHGPSPHLKFFWGDRPPSPPRSPPLHSLQTLADLYPFTQWRRPGAEFGGANKFSADPRFLNDVFFHFLLWQKFLMTFFYSHRPDFSDFP